MFDIKPAKRGIILFFKQYGIEISDNDVLLLLAYKIDLVIATTYIKDKRMLLRPACFKTNKQTILQTLPMLDHEEYIFRNIIEIMLGKTISDDILEAFLLRMDVVITLIRINNLFKPDCVILYTMTSDYLKIKEIVNVYELNHRLQNCGSASY